MDNNIVETIKCKNVLTFTGGGALSFVEVGILQSILIKNPNIKFEAAYGISGGALLAAIVSYFTDYTEAINYIINSNFTNSSVYSFIPFTSTSLLNTEPLRKTIIKLFTELETNQIKGVDINNKIPCYVGATCLNSGLMEYYDIHTFHSIDKKVDLLMASSAIPIIFPYISIKDLIYNGTSHTYVDGGVTQTDLLNEIFINCGDVEVNIYYITYTNPYLDVKNDEYFNGIYGLFNVLYRILTVMVKTYGREVTSISSIEYKGVRNKHSKKVTLIVNYGTKPVNFLLDVLQISKYKIFIENGFKHNADRIFDMSMF